MDIPTKGKEGDLMAKKGFKQNVAEQFISTATPPAPVKKEEGVSIPEGYKLVKESKSERLHLLVRPEIKKALKKAADNQGTSMNDLINNIFEEYLERKGR